MLPERVNSLDQVPAGLREHYGPAEDGNGFEVQIEGAGALRRVLAIERQHRRNAEGRAKELDTQVRHLRGLPKREEMSPREQFLEEAAQRLVGLQGDAKAVELRKIEQELTALADAEIGEIQRSGPARVQALQQTVRRLTRESAATEIITRIRRPGVSVDLLMPTVLARLDVEEREGDFVAIGKDASGRPMSLEALVGELRATPALAPLIAGASPEEKAAHARKVAETLGVTTVSYQG